MGEKRKTGLFFGSFNPVHNGHLIIAGHMLNYTDIDKILFVVSPQNPFKKEEGLLDEKIRFDLLKAAIKDNPGFYASDIEFHMDRPSYTIYTIRKLMANNPDQQYVLILGSDNLDDFDKWKDYKQILELTEIYVYPRPGKKPTKFTGHAGIKQISAPMLDVSSSLIRKLIKEEGNISNLLPDAIRVEILNKGYYK